jgi:hypothetical protein
MKDVSHHLRHVQKKVIQSSRREAVLENNHLNHDTQVVSTPINNSKMSERKFDENHRTPRLLQKPTIY